MHVQDRLAAVEIRRADEHLAVEPAGTQQGRIEVLQAVRGGHDDDLITRREAIQLDQELVQRLVLLAREALTRPGRADGVELVDEDDRRRSLARFVEELAHPRRAEADEHLDECGRALREEARTGLAGHSLGEQRLPRAGRAVEEDAFRDLGAELLEPLRVLEKVDHLLQLCLGLRHTCHVGKAHGLTRARFDVRRPDARHHRERAPEQVDDGDHAEEEHQRQPAFRDPRNVVEPGPRRGDQHARVIGRRPDQR